MTRREDGRETRRRLLNAACDEFAEKGYQKAKVAAICRRAGVNVAAVNYYFGSKSSLYKEAWHHSLSTFEEPVSAVGSAADQLRAYIRNLIRDLAADGESQRFSRLYLMEVVNPSGVIQEAWHDIIAPRRRALHAIIRDIMGQAGVEEQHVLFCELSIVNQCRALVTVKSSDLEYLLGQALTPALIEQLASHIADFSLAGVRAVGSANLPRDAG